jgi:hypothetical protein
MKKKNPEELPVKTDKDLAKLSRKILDDLLERGKLVTEIEENPSEEKKKKLARLDKRIDKNRRISSAQSFAETCAAIDNFTKLILPLIPKQDEEELLRLGDDATAMQFLRPIREIRNQFYDVGRHMFPEEEAYEIMRRFDFVLDKAEEILEEKRRNAAKKFPALARSVMEKEVEMSDDYKKAVKFLMEMVEKRDELAKRLKYVVPEKRREYQANLAEMDRTLNKAEQFLAEKYEKYQKTQHWLNGLRNRLKESSQSELIAMRDYLKENPGANPVLEKLMEEEFPE